MMRRLYLVTYDITDDKRLRRVYKTMCGHGDRLQYSVFRCDLNDRDRVTLVDRLERIIHRGQDQVLLFPLGPAGGEIESAIEALGRPYEPAEHKAIVV